MFDLILHGLVQPLDDAAVTEQRSEILDEAGGVDHLCPSEEVVQIGNRVIDVAPHGPDELLVLIR